MKNLDSLPQQQESNSLLLVFTQEEKRNTPCSAHWTKPKFHFEFILPDPHVSDGESTIVMS